MGGLKDKIPQTYRTFAIACYAIAGLPLAACGHDVYEEPDPWESTRTVIGFNAVFVA